MNKRLIALVAGVLAVALVVAGCGGSDDDEATASSITKAEFIKQADKICREGEKQIQDDFSAYLNENRNVNEPTEADYADLVETTITPNLEQEVEEISDLGAPSGDEEAVEALLEAREADLEGIQTEPKLVTGDEAFAESSKRAKEYGLKVCGAR